MELPINTPALLFPAITLLMLAYTNRFLALSSLVRRLHDEYNKQEQNASIHKQIRNLRVRISMIRNMQALGVLSFLLCVICMYLIFRNYTTAANWIFGFSLVSLLASLIFSMIEIFLSTRAIDVELSDMEFGRRNVFKHILDTEDDDKV